MKILCNNLILKLDGSCIYIKTEQQNVQQEQL